ncbi:MAG: M20 metallopeptidase family protein [Myxococcota bacterium]
MTKSTPDIEQPDAALDAQELVRNRRHLHAHPELSNEEHATAEFIRERLAEYGIEQVETIAETGVVATVEGAHGGPTLAWRADIDALPIQETSEVGYKSKNPGVMHACGHDVHTTVGLGVARQIQNRRDELHGRVKFIFQPAEEASPVDEPVGAEKMAQAGVLEDPDVDAVFGTHCMPALDVGKIGYTGGPVWAGSDLLEIEIRGEKSHGAYPHEGVDAALIASQVVVALQSVVSRRVDARHSCVVTIGQIEAGNSYNILAESAKLTGIVRSLSEEVSEFAKAEIERLARGVCGGMGAECEVRFTPGARPVVNDISLESQAVAQLRARYGEDVVSHPPQLGAEDFAAFSRRVPGCYLFLGIRNEDRGITHPLHTPSFDVDEACLPFGVERFAQMLLDIAAEGPDTARGS